MSAEVPGFDLTPEERGILADAMATAAFPHWPAGHEPFGLARALSAAGNALLANMTAEQCERLAAAKRQPSRSEPKENNDA